MLLEFPYGEIGFCPVLLAQRRNRLGRDMPSLEILPFQKALAIIESPTLNGDSPAPEIGIVCGPAKHVGSKEAGPRVAAIISIVETCRRLSLPLRDYLGSVLPGLANFPINRVAELSPTLERPGSNRRNPAAPSNLCLSDVYS